MLTVESGSEFSIGGGGLLSVAGMVWEGRSANVEEAVAKLARGDPNPDPPFARAARTELMFNLDAVRTSFDALVNGDDWVARRLPTLVNELNRHPGPVAAPVKALFATSRQTARGPAFRGHFVRDVHGIHWHGLHMGGTRHR